MGSLEEREVGAWIWLPLALILSSIVTVAVLFCLGPMNKQSEQVQAGSIPPIGIKEAAGNIEYNQDHCKLELVPVAILMQADGSGLIVSAGADWDLQTARINNITLEAGEAWICVNNVLEQESGG